LCIGAQKSGTTLLYHHLKKCNSIFIPEIKELHFFDNDKNYAKGIEYYYKCFDGAKTMNVKGEITPAYIFFEKVPYRIKNSLENSDKLKFIVLLRNPVDRAYSQYNMSLKIQKNEYMSFEQALIYEKYRLENYSDFINFTYLSRGFYSKQILNYFKYFRRDQFLFIVYEDFVKSQSYYINKILNFIGVDANLEFENEVVFSNNYKEMNEDTRCVLNKIYANEINILENLIDLNLDIWRS